MKEEWAVTVTACTGRADRGGVVPSYLVSLNVRELSTGHEWTVESASESDSIKAEVWRRMTARWCSRAANELPAGLIYQLPKPKFRAGSESSR